METAFFVPLCVYLILQSLQHLDYPDEKTVKNGLAKNAEIKEEIAKGLGPKVSHVTLPLRQHVFNAYMGVFVIELIYKTITKYANGFKG